MHFFYRPLLPLLISYMAGIILARYCPSYESVYLIAWGMFIAAGIRIAFLMFRARPGLVSPIALFFVLGFIAFLPWKFPYYPPGEAASYLDSGYVKISATVAAPPNKKSYCINCLLDNPTINSVDEGKKNLPGKLRGTFYGDCPLLKPGDRISVKGRLKSFKNFNNPGGFDYRQFMADRNIWGNLYTSRQNIKILKKKSNDSGLVHDIQNFRSRISEAMKDSVSQDCAAVLSALVVGERSGIDTELRRAFSRAGVSHLLAISGLHVGIIAACAFFLLRSLLSRFRILLLWGWAARWAAMLTILPVIAYGIVSGMSPSTQRAMIMVMVFLAASVMEKPYNAANTLGVAALCILAVFPPALFSVSFQLSFAAVSAIFAGLYLISGTFLLSRNNEAIEVRILKRTAVFVLVSAFAIAGTAPLVMHYFNQFSAMGIISNLILVPWIGFAAVPAGLCSSLVFVFSETAGTWCLDLTGRILQPALSLIYNIAEIPFSSVYTVTPTTLEITIIYALMIFIGLLFSGTKLKLNRKTAICASLLVITASMADAGYWIHKRFLHQDLRITVMDVGRGHASLLELPQGETMLIDGGGFSDNKIFDVGAYLVAPFLWRNKIAGIDTVVLSHPDADHLNGLLFIMNNFQVKKVISTHQAGESKEYERFLRIIEKRQIQHPQFEDAERSMLINGVKINILYPDVDRKHLCAPCTGSNNCSVVLRIQYKGTSILFPGDIEKCAESRIVSSHKSSLGSDILIAPHHGSKSSSSRRFLDAVDPATVIVPVRESKTGPPSSKILKRYKQLEYRVLRTDENGAVRIIVDRHGEMEIVPTLEAHE